MATQWSFLTDHFSVLELSSDYVRVVPPCVPSVARLQTPSETEIANQTNTKCYAFAPIPGHGLTDQAFDLLELAGTLKVAAQVPSL
jgi:hypothetical protein